MTEGIRLVIVGSVGSAWDGPQELLVRDRIHEVLGRYRDRSMQPLCCEHPENRHVVGFCKDCPPESATHRERLSDANLTVGSGESPEGGVDIWAREETVRMGLDFKGFPPAARGWPFYRKRNQAMADWCTHLVRITSRKSLMYGSGWTRDRAKEQGKTVEEFLI